VAPGQGESTEGDVTVSAVALTNSACPHGKLRGVGPMLPREFAGPLRGATLLGNTLTSHGVNGLKLDPVRVPQQPCGFPLQL
jgi:hypothetical protein